MKTLRYKNYTVSQYESGIIEAGKNGIFTWPTKFILKELAMELGINIKNFNGNLRKSKELGALIIRTIERKRLLAS